MDQAKPIYLVRDVLDKQLVDGRHDPMGRADGIVLVIDPDRAAGRPAVCRIEAGATVLADRLHPRLGRCVRAIARRWGLRRGRPTRIAWSKVRDIGIEVLVDVDAERTNTLAWEQWLAEHITRHIPGGS